MRVAAVSRGYRQWALLERSVAAAQEGLLLRMSGLTSLDNFLLFGYQKVLHFVIKDFAFFVREEIEERD